MSQRFSDGRKDDEVMRDGVRVQEMKRKLRTEGRREREACG